MLWVWLIYTRFLALLAYWDMQACYRSLLHLYCWQEDRWSIGTSQSGSRSLTPL